MLKEVKARWPLILGLLLLLTLWVAFGGSFFKNQDVQTRLLSMHECFKDNQIPCRWVSDLGYGSPVFNYSAPLPYYFGELIFLQTGNLAFSVQLTFIFFILGSSLALYLLYKSWGKFNIKNFLIFSISLAFLLTSKTQSIIILIPVILVVIVVSFLKKAQVKFIWFYISSLLLSFSLSAFYILPLVFERNLVHFGYLPIYAKEAPTEPADLKYQILTGESIISKFTQGSNWLSFKSDTKTHTIIRLSQFYFPEWKVFVDGEQIQVEYKNNSLGLMTFILGEGNHSVYARLYDTSIRTLANLITIAGFAASILLFVLSFPKVHKWLSYYKKGIS